jgi:type II secretory pathway pseudopilin PulG
MFNFLKNQQKIKFLKGQSLVEILIAISIGIIFVLAIFIYLNFFLKSRQDSEKNQVLASLSKELLDNVKIFADANWHNIDTLATTSANHYYLNTSTSSFTAVSGEQNIVISSTTYTRYFYLDDVYRDGSGQIVQSGGTLDPSTKKVTVVYGIQGSTPKSISIYVTRSKNNVFVQTDWSGGSGQTGPITSSNEKFETSSLIDFYDFPGKIKLKLNN